MKGTTLFLSNTIFSLIGWVRKQKVQPDDIEHNTQGLLVLPINDEWVEIVDLQDMRKKLRPVELRKVVVQK